LKGFFSPFFLFPNLENSLGIQLDLHPQFLLSLERVLGSLGIILSISKKGNGGES